MKVPLNIGWLSETELLGKALEARGLVLLSAGKKGVKVKSLGPTNASYVLAWNDRLLFTLYELKQLGFE